MNNVWGDQGAVLERRMQDDLSKQRLISAAKYLWTR